MGMPAARMGDMTAHGGTIILGLPTVLIGGAPAARIGDMHLCPMLTPGVPPIPHVGGPVSKGSAGVLIGGMPAARVGDLCVCVGPPDVIVLGCFTVLIGEVAAGGGGGGGAGAGSGMSAAAGVATAQSGSVESTTKREHWAEMKFTDSAGLPVSGVHYNFTDPSSQESPGVLQPDGTIRRDALNSGQCKAVLLSVFDAKWSKAMAKVGDKLTLSATTEGFDGGTDAMIQIFRRDLHAPDVKIHDIMAKVKNDAVEAEWKYPVLQKPEREEPGTGSHYSAPEYYFEVLVGQCRARSGLLYLEDYIEFDLKDQSGNPIPNEDFVLTLADGSVRRGRVDGNGHKREDKVPSGFYSLHFPGLSSP
jgi:uncharacterized Zn-binding protein involved in type VI secretion